MYKRVIVLALLLMTVFFYSCSSNKTTIKFKPGKVVIPEHSTNVEMKPEKQETPEEKYEKQKKSHYDRQSKSVKKMMKESKKLSKKNTPVNKKRSKCRGKSCLNRKYSSPN